MGIETKKRKNLKASKRETNKKKIYERKNCLIMKFSIIFSSIKGSNQQLTIIDYTLLKVSSSNPFFIYYITEINRNLFI